MVSVHWVGREIPVNMSIHLAYTGETYRYIKFHHLCINTITYLEPINRVAVLNELVTPLVSICYNGSRLLGCTADETIQNRYCRVDNIRVFGSILPDPCAVERLFDHIFIINMLIPFNKFHTAHWADCDTCPVKGCPVIYLEFSGVHIKKYVCEIIPELQIDLFLARSARRRSRPRALVLDDLRLYMCTARVSAPVDMIMRIQNLGPHRWLQGRGNHCGFG